jgi:hypothetical protein
MTIFFSDDATPEERKRVLDYVRRRPFEPTAPAGDREASSSSWRPWSAEFAVQVRRAAAEAALAEEELEVDARGEGAIQQGGRTAGGFSTT